MPNPAAVTMPSIPAPWGDVIDKITILEIKSQKVTNPTALSNIRRELDVLRNVVWSHLVLTDEINLMFDQLREVNASLWAIEDDIRAKERDQDFGSRFIELARSVYLTNDRRAAIKRQINVSTSSTLVEEKQYDT